jgi:hypothetical protein
MIWSNRPPQGMPVCSTQKSLLPVQGGVLPGIEENLVGGAQSREVKIFRQGIHSLLTHPVRSRQNISSRKTSRVEDRWREITKCAAIADW